ncbi:MAG: hypothetical protein HKN91_05315 [Acidimicrobiia bacterium]|nr:hypothetical protein [Acidimicrobiia bacterium]
MDESTAKVLLDRAAAESAAVAAAVRLAVAVPADRVRILRAEADAVLRTRRHLDYREANDWALDAGVVVDAMEAEAASNPSRELLKLIELSVGRVVKVILKSDDSSGMMGDVARRLLAIHEQVSLAGVAEPKALARWMIKFGLDDQDFFTIDPVRYAPALGDKGMALYRDAVAERSIQGRVPFAVKHATERLAVLDGDIETIVALLGQDLTSPHQYTRVAEAMLELARPDDALQWAERGIAATSGWQVKHLYDIAAGVHEANGDLAAVLDVRLDHHQSMPSTSTYGLLRDAAGAVGSWDSHVPSARDVLGRRDRGSLVDVLLADGEVEAAWELASQDGDDLGNDRLVRLAEAYEAVDPAASVDVYVRVVESILATTDRRAYRAAVKQLKNAKRAAVAAGLSTEHHAYLVGLREEHRRRPTLVAMLDKLIAG